MALVRKILEKTLSAGSTSVTFSDSTIPNSLLRVYSTNDDVFPVSMTLSGNVLTISYDVQPSDMGVALEIVKQGLEIIDNLTSDDTDKALSAKQGKALKALIDQYSIPNLTDLPDVNVTDIQNNQVLAWSNSEQKFVNVDQSSGGDTVTITPILSSGTKIADYTINGVSDSLYAPAGGSSALTDLTDVTLTSLADDNILQYDSSTSKWVNVNSLSKSFVGLGNVDNTSDANKPVSTATQTAINNANKVTTKAVDLNSWTTDTTSQSGTTLYKKQITLNHIYTVPSVDVGAASGYVLPTVAEQTAYDLIQYVTVDDTVPCLYLYASDIPSTAFYINVKGVD